MQAELNIENAVTINIWTAAKNAAIPGENVGHISIQTQNHYYSLWPAARENRVRREQLNNKELQKRNIEMFTDIRPANWVETYENDCENENDTQAYVRIKLYSLEPGEIQIKFAALQEALARPGAGWRLIGSNSLERVLSNPKGESCSSLVYQLLKAGGMYTKVSSKLSSHASSSVTPDMLLKHVYHAKKLELRQHPETVNFAEPWETSIEDIRRAYEEANKSLSPKVGDKFEAIPKGICCVL